MNPFAFAMRRPFTTLMLVAGLLSGGVFALKKMGVDILPGSTRPRSMAYSNTSAWARVPSRKSTRSSTPRRNLPGSSIRSSSPGPRPRTSSLPSPTSVRFTPSTTSRSVRGGRVHPGDLVREGQAVKKGDLLFKIVPVLYKARADAKIAEARLAELSSITPRGWPTTTWSLRMSWPCSRPNWTGPRPTPIWRRPIGIHQRHGAFRRHRRPPAPAGGQPGRQGGHPHDPVRQQHDVGLFQRARGRLPRIHGQPGSGKEERIELVLANHAKFKYPSTNLVIEAKFNNETGNIPFRGFPEPGGPAASRSDRHRAAPRGDEGRHRHPPAGGLRGPRQAVRLRRRQG